MSNRLTHKWTKTNEEAFGKSGKIGDAGELVVLKILKEIFGDNVEHYQSNKERQLQGHDFTINDKYGIDLKTNWHGGDVLVDADKIWNSNAKFWMHLNLKTHEYKIYHVSDMRQYLKDKTPKQTKCGYCYFVSPTADFMNSKN